MAGVQPATRRLLTEQAAADKYLPTATFTAAKGAASGVATLGADGRLPAAQAPANLTPPTAVLTTATLSNATATPANSTASLPVVPGTYAVDVVALSAGGASTPVAQVNLAHSTGAATGTLYGIRSASGAAAALSAAVGGTGTGLGGTNTGTALASGIITVTAAGNLLLTLASSTTTASQLLPGTSLRLQRLS